MKAKGHRSRLTLLSILAVLTIGFLLWSAWWGSLVSSPFERAQTTATNTLAQASPTAQPSIPSSASLGVAPTNSGPINAFEQYRATLLSSHYGTNQIKDLVHALVEMPGGSEVQRILQALALRKGEALPMVKERLRTGEMWEKHMLTKFLRACPWPETKDELLALAQSDSEHWLPRQGAVFALGSLGDASSGPAVAAILRSPKATINLQMAAVSTLSRIQFADAVSAITPYAQAENIHLRLFAMRALAELGVPADKDFLLSSLRSDDYVVRQEASEALWKVPGRDVTDALKAVAKGDFNEAVRHGASQALLRRELAGRGADEKADILRRALDTSERLTCLWILRAALEEAGVEGRRLVEMMAVRDDHLGERSRAYLILANTR